MTLTKRTGKRGRVQCGTGNSILTMRKWSLTEKGDDVETYGFENAGYTSGLIALRECEFSFEGVWDAAVNWQDDPPGLFVRHDLQNLKLFLDSVDGTFYSFALSRIITSTFTVDPRQALIFAVTGKNQGLYSITTGSYTANAAPNYFFT